MIISSKAFDTAFGARRSARHLKADIVRPRHLLLRPAVRGALLAFCFAGRTGAVEVERMDPQNLL
jgi:hypothetical protein